MKIEREIQSYKVQHKIGRETGSSEYDLQLTHLRDALSVVQGKLSNAESTYTALLTFKEGGRYNYTKVAEALNDPALEKLRAALAEAESQIAAGKIKFGTSYPEVKAKEVQAQVIKQEIEAEAKRKLQTSANELEALRNEQRNLTAKVEAIKLEVNELGGAEVHLRELQRERDAMKTLYDSTLARLTQTAPQQTLALSDFKVLIDAAVPTRPKIPFVLIWIAGGVFGLTFELGLAVFLDYFNDKLVHLDVLEATLPVQILARVPVISKEDLVGIDQSKDSRLHYLRFAKEFPQSLFTNCLLNAKLMLSIDNEIGANSVIMVTSTVQGEGKTHITSNLASLSTLLGEKTLLIDLDARKASEYTRHANGISPGKMSDFLEKASLSGLTVTPGADFDIVTPANLEGVAWLKLFHPQMQKLLDFARAEYKQVWIDTPPLQLFTDALILASKVDGVIIVAQWSKTTRRQVLSTRDQITKSGGRVLGVIINKVKVDSLISPFMAYYNSYYKTAGKPSSDEIEQEARVADAQDLKKLIPEEVIEGEAQPLVE